MLLGSLGLRMGSSSPPAVERTLDYDTPGSITIPVPAYRQYLIIEMWGAGGGGGTRNAKGSYNTGGNGGATSIASLSLTAGGGAGSRWDSPPVGGTATGGDINIPGGSSEGIGGGAKGGDSPNGGIGGMCRAGSSGATGDDGGHPGGGGGSATSTTNTARGAGAGGYLKKTYTPGALSGSLSAEVGLGGAGYVDENFIGGDGGDGRIRLTWL